MTHLLQHLVLSMESGNLATTTTAVHFCLEADNSAIDRTHSCGFGGSWRNGYTKNRCNNRIG